MKQFSTYLPARSFFMESKLYHPNHKERTQARLPEHLTMADLEMLLPTSLVPYNNVLISGGHADLKMESEEQYYLRNRDRTTTNVTGDSGGFQIGRGRWAGDWAKMDKVAQGKRQAVNQWQQAVCDWGVTLDLPYWVFDDPVAAKKIGVASKQDCLRTTIENLDYYMSNSNKTCKWLNVLQGSTLDESRDFYNQVKQYNSPGATPHSDWAQGWCMGGIHSLDPEAALRRIVDMKHDGLLQNTKRIHFLGQSKIHQALWFDELQRAINAHAEACEITFDSSYPLIRPAKGEIMNNWTFERKWVMNVIRIPYGPKHVGDKTPANAYYTGKSSPVLDTLTAGDLAVNPETKSGLDTISSIFLQLHCLHVFEGAMNEARQLFADGYQPQIMDNNTVSIGDIIRQALDYTDRDSAQQWITDNTRFLTKLGRREADGQTMFNTLFQ